MLTAFNLTASPVRRTVTITPAEMAVGAAPEVTGAPAIMAGGALTIDLDLPSLSPLVVAIDTTHSRAGSA